MPALQQWEIEKYWEIFQGLKPVDNKLLGEAVLPVLKNSRLPQPQLAAIWQLLDIDEDGLLDFEEFCIAMRLIFDIVNDLALQVPESLPSWLVPASKAHLVSANAAVSLQSNVGLEYDDDDDNLSDEFDWYISPSNKATYESVYYQNTDKFGRIRFDALEGLYASLQDVPRSDCSSAWNLVNPKLFETIDKDQALVFLHILHQRQNKRRIPRGVPALLRATFSKETPSYDLSEPAAKANIPPSRQAFASEYLSKMSVPENKSGTDFSATAGTDWEQARLKRELADLESVLARARNERQGATPTEANPQLSLEKYELEQMLKYMEEQLRVEPNGDLTGVRDDIELIEQQINSLQEESQRRAQVLASIEREIATLG